MSTDPSTPENDANLSGLGRALMGTNEGSKPAGPWVPPTAEELHQILPQYEIVKMLGRGGMGAVYMGRQTALDRPVAIKILSAQLEESDMGFSERFKNEARAMGKLNHPSIVSVYEFGQHESGLLYIVMEYVDGTDVARMIAKKGRLHTEHAMAITAHVCDALAYAHERGIIHRDIKPANIMVGYDGMVKVADFGLAKVSTSGGQTLGLTQSGMAMGTLHFMAPEALMLGTSVDHRADIYAVGVMLYQMLTGKLPQGVFSLPSLQVPGLDPRYDTIIAKAMMEDREERYQSAREMRSDLDGILTKPVVKADAEAAKAQPPVLPTQARPQRPGGKPVMRQSAAPSVPQPAPHSSQSWLWMSALGLLVLGGAAWWMIQPRSQTAQLAGAPEKAASEPSSPMATAPATPGATHEEGWMPFLSKPEDFPANSPLELRDGWVVKKAGAPTSTLNRGKDVMDGAIRAEFTGLNCTLRARSVSSTSYNLMRKGDWLGLQWERWDDVEKKRRIFTTIKEVTLPDPPGADEPFTLELRTVGSVITGSLNGREALRVEDDRGSKAGLCGLSLGDARARKIEQLILDPQSNLAAATTPPASTEAAVRMILGKGGRATILVGKEQRIVTSSEELPKGGYEVVELRLVAPTNKAVILTSNDMRTMAGLAALERFILGGITIADGDLTVLRTLPRLEFLELRDCKGLMAESFAHLKGIQSLRHLRPVNVTELDDKALPAILALPQLEILSLHGCKGVNSNFIESLEALPNLNGLTVSGFQFGKATDLGRLRALTKLELYSFRDAALDTALSSPSAGGKIDFLAFHGGEISDSQMRMLARWPALRSLLLENVKLPGSRLISLSSSQIQVLDAGIYDRQFDDEALLSAGRMVALKNLSLGPDSRITEAGIAAFRKARPDVKITRRQASGQASEDAVVAVAVPAVIPPAARPAVPPPSSAPTPLPKTDPPTWIDTKGRSIQAKFVRIEGANVLLEIAGKAAPVALNTLSAASQQQARDLQAQLPAGPAAVTVSQAPSVSPTLAASPPPLPNTTVITPGWRPMFPDEAALRATPGVTQLADGWWRLDHVFFEAPAKARNLRLRVHARFQVGAAPSLIARWDSLNPGRGPSGDYYGYQATFYDTGGGKDDPWVNGIASVSRRNGGVPEPGGYRARNSPRFKKDLNLRPGDEYDMEFELVGENFKLGIDGQEGALIGFASCPGSGFGLFSQGALEVSRMEWQELDEKGKVIPAAPPEVLDWTDTQGKVLRGQFKGMDIKGNVLLDLSGRITPVPWSLLSPASQRQVRAVHAPSTLNSQP